MMPEAQKIETKGKVVPGGLGMTFSDLFYSGTEYGTSIRHYPPPTKCLGGRQYNGSGGEGGSGKFKVQMTLQWGGV